MNYFTILVTVFLLIASTGVGQEKFLQEGLASFYADKFEGRKTANGEIYKHSKSTAAHLTLPFGTFVKVTNLMNGKNVIVRINDRGPFISDRVIDVSKSAAEKLDFIESGLVKVKVEIVDTENETTEFDEVVQSTTSVVVDNSTQNNSLYYSFDVDLINPTGYGIQIGCFKEMVNLVKLSERLNLNNNNKVIVQTKKINGTKLYRFIIGPFATEQDALEVKKQYINEYPDCFVTAF